MTQEEKDLLLKDLCARLPYGVKVAYFNADLTHHSEPKSLIAIECINNLNYSRLEDEDGNTTIVEFVKPYLFPLSNMTDRQTEEYESLCIKVTSECGDLYGTWFMKDYYYDTVESIDYLYKNHIDIRGLIPKGLALDATGKNIY